MNQHSDQRWRELALCAQTDPETFFPEKGETAAAAKQICIRCEVRADCLTDALNRREPYGVWGGLSTHERKVLLQQRRADARRAGRAA